MLEHNAAQLLAKVMRWEDQETVIQYLPTLQLLADFKYDHYQRFSPGKRFIESLALWLNQIEFSDREAALDMVMNELVYLSEAEFFHLVFTAYPDFILQERMRLVAQENGISEHYVGKITRHPRFEELRRKSLYLGLSDGARTAELRRASGNEISNEQIWTAYELGEVKAEEMLGELKASLEESGEVFEEPRFNLIWLLDDFSGSGYSYIRYDSENRKYKGKIKKIYDRLHRGDLVDTSHYEVFLLLYVATRQAIDHIEYWSERFTSEQGYKPLQVRVLCPIESDVALTRNKDKKLQALLNNTSYYDNQATDKHILVGGTADARLGFAECALPIVLSHNTPNNSIYLLWGPESYKPFGLFPRMSRHREF